MQILLRIVQESRKYIWHVYQTSPEIGLFFKTGFFVFFYFVMKSLIVSVKNFANIFNLSMLYQHALWGLFWIFNIFSFVIYYKYAYVPCIYGVLLMSRKLTLFLCPNVFQTKRHLCVILTFNMRLKVFTKISGQI